MSSKQRIQIVFFRYKISIIILTLFFLIPVFGQTEKIPNISSNQTSKEISQFVFALVDSSGSMKKNDPDKLRIQAIQMMLDTMSPDTGFALVDFDSKNKVLSRPLRIGSFNSKIRKRLREKVQKIDAAGSTNIASALKKAAKLKKKDLKKTSIVLLTDGRDKDWKGDAGMIPENTPVHTIALSKEADRRALSKLSASTGGIADIARSARDLPRIVSKLFGQASGEEVLATYEGVIQQGEKISYDLYIGDSTGRIQVQLSWPGSDIDLALVDPDGAVHSIEDAVSQGYGKETANYDVIRLNNPDPGKWEMQLSGKDVSAQGEPYTTRVSSQGGNIETSWETDVVVPEAGEEFSVDIVSKNNTVEWEKAQYSVKGPSGKSQNETVSMSSVAQILGGSEGQRAASIRPENPGLYRVRVTVFGQTQDKNRIMRSFDRTFEVAPQGSGIQYPHGIKPFIRRRR